jgi:hypothetical protein
MFPPRSWRERLSVQFCTNRVVTPDSAEPLEVLTRLLRQCAHVALDAKARKDGKPIKSPHGPEFRALAVMLGFQGKMRKPDPGPFLHERLAAIAPDIGPLPHAALDPDHGRAAAVSLTGKKRQKGRNIKVECPGTAQAPCGYNPYLSRYWIEKLGAVCPKHGPIDVSRVLAEAAENETKDDRSSPPASSDVAQAP